MVFSEELPNYTYLLIKNILSQNTRYLEFGTQDIQ